MSGAWVSALDSWLFTRLLPTEIIRIILRNISVTGGWASRARPAHTHGAHDGRGAMRAKRRTLGGLIAAVLTAGALAVAGMVWALLPASAASLQQVTNFGNNPSNLQMFVDV